MIAFLSLGFIAAVPLLAQPAPATSSNHLARIDLDGDRRLALSEYRDYMSRGFRVMDADGNGLLEGDELPVSGARPVRLDDYLDALAQAFARQDRTATAISMPPSSSRRRGRTLPALKQIGCNIPSAPARIAVRMPAASPPLY